MLTTEVPQKSLLPLGTTEDVQEPISVSGQQWTTLFVCSCLLSIVKYLVYHNLQIAIGTGRWIPFCDTLPEILAEQADSDRGFPSHY